MLSTRFSKFLDHLKKLKSKHTISVMDENILQVTHQDNIFSYKVYPLYSIDELSMIDKLLDVNEINQQLNQGREIIFDLSSEAIDFYQDDIFLKQFIDLLNEMKIDSGSVHLINSNYSSVKAFKKWKKRLSIKSHLNVIGYNFYLHEYHWEACISPWLNDNRQAIVAKARESIDSHRLRDKHYMTLNFKARQNRALLIMHLLQRGIMDKGSVTYFGDKDKLTTQGIEGAKRCAYHAMKYLPSRDRIIDYYNVLEEIRPITLGSDYDRVSKELWDRKPGQINFLIPEVVDNVITDFNNYFEIVTETYHTDENNLYITEKTIRPILRLQPFIIMGSPYTIKLLKKMGFETFHPYIDESYDDIVDPYYRMEAIFNEIDRLCSMTIEQIHDLYCEIWDRLEYNYNHFLDNTSQFYEKEICAVVDGLVLKNKNVLMRKMRSLYSSLIKLAG